MDYCWLNANVLGKFGIGIYQMEMNIDNWCQYADAVGGCKLFSSKQIGS